MVAAYVAGAALSRRCRIGLSAPVPAVAPALRYEILAIAESGDPDDEDDTEWLRESLILEMGIEALEEFHVANEAIAGQLGHEPLHNGCEIDVVALFLELDQARECP